MSLERKFCWILSLVIMSCSPNVENRSNNQDHPKKQTISHKSFKNSTNRATNKNRIINNDFANKPFGFVVQLENIDSLLPEDFVMAKKPIKNEFSGEMDTVYEFNYRESSFRIFSRGEKNFLVYALVKDTKIIMFDSIHIGMDKSTFLRKLNKTTNLKCDTIVITDSNEYASHQFIFVESLLREVEIKPGFD